MTQKIKTCIIEFAKINKTIIRKNRSYSLNPNQSLDHNVSGKPFHLGLRKYADNGLKNHYIISSKTSINNDKTTYKK